jgi:hypothetical protein
MGSELMARTLGRRRAAAAVTVLLAMVWLGAGCAPETKGGPGDNLPPEVFLVNIPVDGTEFATSPTIRWYGTDRDGRIIRFDHTVVLTSEIDSIAAANGIAAPQRLEWFIENILTDEYDYWISIFVDEVIGNPNQDRIRLFASPLIADCDSTESGGVVRPDNCISQVADQYFFIRAIDDQGDQSTIKYRNFLRRNHWPETSISPTFDAYDEYISLPQLSETYRGIRLTWGGEDRLDFVPPALPDLEYHWRVYGPFDARATLADTLDLDPVLQSQNADPLVGVWIRDTTADIWDLWNRADVTSPSDTTREGFFLFAVTARDDASIQDTTPAFVSFKAVYPQFEREVLLVDDNDYNCSTQPSGLASRARPDKPQELLVRLLDAAYPEWQHGRDVWWRHRGPAPGLQCPGFVLPFDSSCGNLISMTQMAKHKLTIWIDDDICNQINRPDAPPKSMGVMRRYLDAGGKLWIISRHGLLSNFNTAQASPPRLLSFIDTPSEINPLAVDYFDIEAMFYPAWRRAVIPAEVFGFPTPAPSSNDEFIGAVSTPDAVGLPSILEIDPIRVRDSMYINQALWNLLIPNGVDHMTGVPDVNIVVRGNTSTPLYTFKSWRPNGPIPPYGAPSFVHNKLVMLRRVGPNTDVPLYKTAYTTFPLWYLKEDHARELVTSMVDWFMLPYELTPP